MSERRLPDEAAYVRTARRIALGVTLGALIAGGAIESCTPARADDDVNHLSRVQFAYAKTYGATIICPAVDADPTIGMAQVQLLAVMTEGFTQAEAQSVLSSAVQMFCPNRFELIERSEATPLPVPVKGFGA